MPNGADRSPWRLSEQPVPRAVLSSRGAIGVAVLGRHALRRIGSPRLFNFLRVDPRSGREVAAPIFGLESSRPDYYDVSIGGRVRLWQDRLVAFANAVFPLNRDSFRAEVIPLVGLELLF